MTEECSQEIEKSFDIIELQKQLKEKFGTLLVGDVEFWWHTLAKIWFGNEIPTWEEFVE